MSESKKKTVSETTVVNEKDSSDKYKKKYSEAQKKNKELILELDSMQQELDSLKEKVKKLQKDNDVLTQKVAIPKELKKEKSLKINSNRETVLQQYDLVLKIDSLLRCNRQGWPIQYRDPKKIKEWSLTEQIAVGVIGRENLGKTWLINQICQENFPSGYYYRTEGLSLKYCIDKERKLKVMLDSAGMNGAIFFFDEELEKRYQKMVSKSEGNNEEERDNKIKETMINDRTMTEYFIQNFILYSCNVILIVVELLTQHDQKIIERIKSMYFKLKTIIVVHNYFKLDSKNQVLKRAREEIKGAFKDTKERIIPNSEEVPFYLEQAKQKDKKSIFHLILGREGHESGDFFNETTLNYLSTILDVECGIGPFPFIEKLNKYWEEKNHVYFKPLINKEEGATLPKFKEEKKDAESFLRLDYKGHLPLRPAAFNVLGALKDFDINYYVFESPNGKKRYKIYYFELPGITEKPTLKLNKEGVLKLILNRELPPPDGCKCVEGENNLQKFEKSININDDFGSYRCDKDFTKVENGMLKMKFDLIDEEEEKIE